MFTTREANAQRPLLQELEHLWLCHSQPGMLDWAGVGLLEVCSWTYYNPAAVAHFLNLTTDDRRRAAGLSQQQRITVQKQIGGSAHMGQRLHQSTHFKTQNEKKNFWGRGHPPMCRGHHILSALLIYTCAFGARLGLPFNPNPGSAPELMLLQKIYL